VRLKSFATPWELFGNNYICSHISSIVPQQKLKLCVPECSVDAKDAVDIPMIPCGLCERWFHPECLGLPRGSPAHCIRGLYLCQHCLTDLRELRRLTRPQRHLEARVQAMEALLTALDAGHSLLRELVGRQWPEDVLDDDLVVRAGGGQLVNGTFASLLRERADLERKWTEVISGVRPVRRRGVRQKPRRIVRSAGAGPEGGGGLIDRFDCHLCAFWSPRWSGLRVHLKLQHDQLLVYNCSVCQKQFHLFHQFRLHREASPGCRKASFSKTFVRDVSGVNGVTASAPADASAVDPAKKTYTGAPSKKLCKLRRTRNFRCPHCPTKFLSAAYYARHIRAKHKGVRPRKLLWRPDDGQEHWRDCRKCGRTFLKQVHLDAHLRRLECGR
jgi:hypothetical protein